MRVLYLWFKYLATELQARHVPPDEAPHVLTELNKSTQRLAALSSAAKSEGLFLGQPLADARILVSGLRSAPINHQSNRNGLKALARICRDYSPLVALDGEDALALDIRGLDRLFGGEGPLLHAVQTRLEDLGFTVRAAIADTKGAAWAVVHYGASGTLIPPGGAMTALATFPPQALRLSPHTSEALTRLGIKTIDALMRLDRGQVARRYGRDVFDRLEQAMGRHGEPLCPLPPPQYLSARLRFAQPLGLVQDLMIAAERLVDHLIPHLRAKTLGLTRLKITAEATDGHEKIAALGFAEPTRDTSLILKLLEAKLDTFKSDFGFDSLRLSAQNTAPLANTQNTLLQGGSDGEARALLLANLGNRLGFGRLQHLVPTPTHLPDQQTQAQPILQAVSPPQVQTNLSPRPTLRLPQPEPIQILQTTDPQRPPLRFSWRRQIRHLLSATGPERVTPPWWQSTPGWKGVRDYWCVQTHEGPRLWLFTEQEESRWFIAGDMG